MQLRESKKFGVALCAVESPWMTPREVFDLTGIPLQKLDLMRMHSEGLPYVKLGRGPASAVRYARADVQKLIDRGKSFKSEEELDWLMPSQAAEILGVSPKTLWAWRMHGVGVSFISLGPTVATDIMYRRQDVEAFALKQSTDSTTYPVIPKRGYVRDIRTPEQRARDRARNKREREAFWKVLEEGRLAEKEALKAKRSAKGENVLT
jgi:hypothetical protein